MRPERNLRVIVLAGQRAGAADPLSLRFGVTNKCLAPLRGQPLIAHVVRTVTACPGVAEVAISVEASAFAELRRALPFARNSEPSVTLVAAADNIADSVMAAARDHVGPLLITTADNVLLSAASVAAMRLALARQDVAIAMASREAVLAAHPDGQRRFYRFRDGAYSNCNLYGLGDVRALHAAEIFRGGGQFAKKASRIVEAFGLANLVLLRLGLLTLPQALRRVSRRIGLGIAPVILTDGSQAIDVDNDRTYGVVEQLLAQRGEPRRSAPESSDEIAEHELALAAGYRP